MGRYALLIGTDEYIEFPSLNAPSKDVQALEDVLKNDAIGYFDEVKPLINQPWHTVRTEFFRFLKDKKSDDLLLIYFSGHGVLSDLGDVYLAFKDTQKDLVDGTSIDANSINNALDQCVSKRKVLILDCCHSGAIGKDKKAGVVPPLVIEPTFKGNGKGRVVLTASGPTQLAADGNRVDENIELSLFTHFLVDGLKNGQADIDGDGEIALTEWYEYVHDKVSEKQPNQKPLKFEYATEGKFVIAKNSNKQKAQDSEEKNSYNILTITIGDNTITPEFEGVSDVGEINKEVDPEYKIGRWEKDLLIVLHRLLIHRKIADEDEIKVLGELLFRKIFIGKVEKYYRTLLEESRIGLKPKLNLRLRFSGEEDQIEKLKRYPWEYLYDPVREIFLAKEMELTLSRGNSADPIPTPIKVLVVRSQPKGLESKTPAIVTSVMDDLRIQADGRIVVDEIDMPTWENLKIKIRDIQPTILHIVGSGRVSANKGELALLGKEEIIPSPWRKAADFVDLVKNKKIQIVFLELSLREDRDNKNNSDFAPETYWESSTAMAEPLVKAGIPTVVAMQFPIPNDVAKNFLKSFYEQLLAGNSVEAAVQVGRSDMSCPYFGSPVVYVRQEIGNSHRDDRSPTPSRIDQANAGQTNPPNEGEREHNINLADIPLPNKESGDSHMAAKRKEALEAALNSYMKAMGSSEGLGGN